MRILYILAIGLGFSFTFMNKEFRKIISDDSYNYVFYVTDKNIVTYTKNKEYYWFRRGKIQHGQSGSDGQLLQGVYTKSYRIGGLAEQGFFNNGLKSKRWNTWYQNGQLKEIFNWSNGVRSGKYEKYSDTGTLLISGFYRSEDKHGRWIDYKTKDTLYFRKGEKIVKKEKEAKPKDKKAEEPKIKFVDRVKKWFSKKTPEQKAKIKKEKEERKQKKKQQKKKNHKKNKKKNAKQKKIKNNTIYTLNLP